jgi:hypothetical protein
VFPFVFGAIPPPPHQASSLNPHLAHSQRRRARIYTRIYDDSCAPLSSMSLRGYYATLFHPWFLMSYERHHSGKPISETCCHCCARLADDEVPVARPPSNHGGDHRDVKVIKFIGPDDRGWGEMTLGCMRLLAACPPNRQPATSPMILGTIQSRERPRRHINAHCSSSYPPLSSPPSRAPCVHPPRQSRAPGH